MKDAHSDITLWLVTAFVGTAHFGGYYVAVNLMHEDDLNYIEFQKLIPQTIE